MTRHVIGDSGDRQVPDDRTVAVVQRTTPADRLTFVPLLLSLMTASVVLLVLTDTQSPVRGLVAAAFVLLAPGWALLDIWDLAGGWIGAALVVALSISLATIVPLLLFYANAWSSDTALLVLAFATLTANVVSFIRHTHCVRLARM